MKTTIKFFVLAIVFVFTITSCAVAQPRGARPCYHNNHSSVTRVINDVAHVTGTAVVTINRVEQEAAYHRGQRAIYESRRTVQVDDKAVKTYSPGRGYARKIQWQDAAVYSNGYQVIFAQYDQNGRIQETVFNTSGCNVGNFVVATRNGVQSIRIVSVSGRIDLYYSDGSVEFLAGK